MELYLFIYLLGYNLNKEGIKKKQNKTPQPDNSLTLRFQWLTAFPTPYQSCVIKGLKPEILAKCFRTAGPSFHIKELPQLLCRNRA